MVHCRNIYPCIKVTPNQNRLECDPNHLQMLCWCSGLCRMIVQGFTKPALVGLVLAGASDWVSIWLPSCAFCSVCWLVWAEQCFYSNKTSITPFLSVFFWKSTITRIKLQRYLSWEGNLPCQHSQWQRRFSSVCFEESSFHRKHQIWLFMGVTARRLHGKTSGYSLSSWVLSRSTCW